MPECSRTRTTESPPPADPKISALFLDLDGSILEIVARPHEVDPDAELTSILERLGARMGDAWRCSPAVPSRTPTVS